MNSSGFSLLMRLSEMHLKAPWSLKFSIRVAVILLLCFNLKGPFFLGSAALVINANETDRQALLQFKAKIAGDQLGIMRSWNNSVHFANGLVLNADDDIRELPVGQLPSNISGCWKLKHLYIGHNLLVGEIPATLGHLSNLKELGLSNNTLRGSIPSFLGNLSSLEKIYLSLNRLSGVIPEAIDQLKNLTAHSMNARVG
ncbi:LRR receptor-like serine/threonine-protein kinase EFR [Durio zibethinus]|uniref:LRR receptor-like serine/threonine-protein kinase EFR n=1 Tax=Durio zibethinus TaxID=66656 RepID=A0A6P6B5I2_DURZI|nr:LRR receptor-like serine/threonine-protein kinase EFR [Durio zibethinus]